MTEDYLKYILIKKNLKANMSHICYKIPVSSFYTVYMNMSDVVLVYEHIFLFFLLAT